MKPTPNGRVADALAHLKIMDSPAHVGAAARWAKAAGVDDHAMRRSVCNDAQTDGRLAWIDSVNGSDPPDAKLALVISAGGGLVRVPLTRNRAAGLIGELAKVLA